RRLQIVKAPSFGVVDEPLELTLRISDPTVGPGETIRPTMLVDGVGQRIERLPFNQDVTVTLSLDHRGASIVELTVPELPGELSTVNNSAVLS
ncbi:MAG TPA: hypothetical protein DD390_15865, partial [Rhodospirillaceae bacterium]|nr:hypothetical protein [Rhodospirillaceae bacterium]